MTVTVLPASTPPPRLRLALGALGVVFGDIGTSPLYAFRESFIGPHRLPIDRLHVMGVLSLIFWALILVVTVKYVLITMRADNRGEGGSFALLALIRRVTPRARLLPFLSMAALLATALLYGDAVITPAISILSAVEGLALVDEGLAVAVVPITLVIVLAMFAIQHFGTSAVGRYFGPIMLGWFAVIGLLGAVNLAERPEVLLAASPAHAVAFVAVEPMLAFLTMSTVVLTITGAEALFADMGHFGRKPISNAWVFVVLPALLLCYAGQAALLLQQPGAVDQLFFLLGPRWTLWPMLALATVATVIASQSAITGAFSVTQQAIQLGYLPRLKIVHTSSAERGQVFVPAINALLCAAVLGLVLGFRSSSALAAAYGFAVTATMVLTSVIMAFVIFRIWRLRRVWMYGLFAVLFAFDLALFSASATKIPDGAWLPLAIAAALMLIFMTWSRGRELLAAHVAAEKLPVADFLRTCPSIQRVPGMAIYFTRDPGGVPVALLHSLKHYHVLHDKVLLLTIRTALIPHVKHIHRLHFEELAPGTARAILTFGFRDEPNVPKALGYLPIEWQEETLRIGYVLGRQILIPAAHSKMPLWQETLFAIMVRLAGSAMEYYRLPPDRVVELGSQVEI
ncbi:MAG: KUP/HAK/KT family potassium transporter [Reyranella sp.]|uniref:potassium transporter Kup n=1 Tax=Reyranella sp. TaxID=1929291 RepID=UPI001AC372EF|nr:KUP/HAK/KT family potassium transporter [Reyranella sp.]MBN9088728.1 KUP/HAK/KT family potassium transporter [Reyranella sp.]